MYFTDQAVPLGTNYLFVRVAPPTAQGGRLLRQGRETDGGHSARAATWQSSAFCSANSLHPGADNIRQVSGIENASKTAQDVKK